ncbi:unnamed protein product [Thelazia callipaeda]|uniref:Protein kinase domain-containing protein n=1 Tax=Thelazia callipaeda TaxID=103827 RepID=A0A0N5DAL7_THECL|nr:unnamed protein product [Thelazia callipaeda]
MARRRFFSKGNATFVDGLDETIKRRLTKRQSQLQYSKVLVTLMNDMLGKESESELNEVDGKKAKRCTGDKAIGIDELEYRRLVNEIREAENYELIIEYDESDEYANDSMPEISRLAAESTKNKLSQNAYCTDKMELSSCLKQAENSHPVDFAESFSFKAHSPQPSTSTPVSPAKKLAHKAYDEKVFEKLDLSPIGSRSRIIKNTIKDNRELSRNQVQKEIKSQVYCDTNLCPTITEGTNATVLQQSLSHLTILHSPNHWGFQNADNVPFYLNGFLWSAAYAKNRDYKKELLHLCIQKDIKPWRMGKAVLDLSSAVKLGEGTFGEVFRVLYHDEIVALKVIPIGSDTMVNGDNQKSFRDIAAELIVSKELSSLVEIEDGYSTQGFIRLKGALVVKGKLLKDKYLL